MPDSVLAAQLYTVREFTKTPADIVATLKKIARIGYKAVQLSALGEMDPAELRLVCDDLGLTICATHISYQKMLEDPQGIIELHNTYGCKYAGIGGLPQDRRGSAEGFAAFAREASEVARKLAQGGVAFIYHNHSFEFEKFGDRTGYQILVEESDPEVFLFEPDTYWIQHAGASPAAWLRRLKGRAPCVHLKDMANKGGKQLMAEVGEGNLEWPEILAACREAGTRWYIVEQDTCQRDPFESLEISLRNLEAMGLR